MKTSIALFFMGIALAACGGDTTPKMQPEMKSASSTSSQPRKLPDEKAALDALRKINEAQSTYFKVNRRYALTFEELVEAHLLMSEPSEETGYEFKLRPAADAQTYRISLAPNDSTFARYFFTDEKGVIRGETGKNASADSPAVK